MNLVDLDLKLLLVLEAVDQERSVSRAAVRLGMTQPGVSSALARLRRVLGDELFVRAGGRMEPTPAAARMTDGVTAALTELRTALARGAPFVPATTTLAFTIASTDYTSFVLLPAIVRAFAAHAPNATLRVVGYEKTDIARQIDAGAVDVALGVFPLARGRDVLSPLFSERFVGICRTGNPARRGGRVTLDAYLRARHALVSVRRDTVGEIDRVLGERGLRRTVGLVVPHMMALSGAIAASDLLAAIPARAAERFVGEGLVCFDLPIKVPRWQVHMLWTATRRTDAGNAWLRAQIKAAAR